MKIQKYGNTEIYKYTCKKIKCEKYERVCKEIYKTIK